MRVVKRDGNVEEFKKAKIVRAIQKAYESVNGYNNNSVANLVLEVLNKLNSRKEISVEEVEQIVMDVLKARDKDVYQAYHNYKLERDKKRNSKARKTFRSIVGVESNSITRENANMNADTPAGMMMKFASETTKNFTDTDLISPEYAEAHNCQDFHIHDKDYYPTKSLTCVQHPLDKILRDGFRAGHGSSRPAKRIETASILGCISLETCQNEMHGGQAIPAFDFYLAPFVKKTFREELKDAMELLAIPPEYVDVKRMKVTEYKIRFPKHEWTPIERAVQFAINKTVKRVHQAMEAFIHNMNTIHSRGGNQVVFSSINYGTDFSPEGRCIIREMLECTWDGVGNGETAIFPIQIWKKKRGINYLTDDPNYDLYKLACKVSARRFFPTFTNLDATFNQNNKWDINDPERYKYEVAEMGCRTRVFEDRHGEKTSIGRGNLSFTTANIVRPAIECMEIEDYKERVKKYFERLDSLIDLVGEQLHERYIFQASALAKQFPLLMSSLWIHGETLNPDDTIESVIKHGTLGIGFIGLAEALVALTGKHHGESEESQKLGLKIVSFLKGKAELFSEKYDLNYSVLATPAEGLSGRFVKTDAERYGKIKGVTDREYYTNSNHVPVYYKCTASHKAKVEGAYHELTLGGHIFYVEMDGDLNNNPQAIMSIVDLMDRENLGYVAINHTRNRCLDCGFENGDKHLAKCPNCGGLNIDVLQRITGYLVGCTDRWNSAKKAELRDRVVHMEGKFE